MKQIFSVLLLLSIPYFGLTQNEKELKIFLEKLENSHTHSDSLDIKKIYDVNSFDLRDFMLFFSEKKYPEFYCNYSLVVRRLLQNQVTNIEKPQNWSVEKKNLWQFATIGGSQKFKNNYQDFFVVKPTIRDDQLYGLKNQLRLEEFYIFKVNGSLRILNYPLFNRIILKNES